MFEREVSMKRLRALSASTCLLQDETEEKDFKQDHKFADLMQEKTEAVSEFAQRRTIQQQRKYLPIFAIRNEVSHRLIEIRSYIPLGFLPA